MFRHYEKVLRRIVDKVRAKLPDRVISVYAFGSRVRGDHDIWSDFDVMVVVEKRDPVVESEVMDIFVEEELKSGIIFTPVIKDVESFEQEREYNTPFYENIIKEGILI